MKVSINELLNNPELIEQDECSFFYDWFCKNDSLNRRALALLPKLRFLVNEGILNGDANYVWFKNNCPVNGSLYDDIRISTLDDDETFLGGFCPKTGHNVENKCTVWVLNPDLEQRDFLNWNTFKKEVKLNPEYKAFLVNVFNKR